MSKKALWKMLSSTYEVAFTSLLKIKFSSYSLEHLRISVSNTLLFENPDIKPLRKASYDPTNVVPVFNYLSCDFVCLIAFSSSIPGIFPTKSCRSSALFTLFKALTSSI